MLSKSLFWLCVITSFNLIASFDSLGESKVHSSESQPFRTLLQNCIPSDANPLFTIMIGAGKISILWDLPERSSSVDPVFRLFFPSDDNSTLLQGPPYLHAKYFPHNSSAQIEIALADVSKHDALAVSVGSDLWDTPDPLQTLFLALSDKVRFASGQYSFAECEETLREVCAEMSEASLVLPEQSVRVGETFVVAVTLRSAVQSPRGVWAVRVQGASRDEFVRLRWDSERARLEASVVAETVGAQRVTAHLIAASEEAVAIAESAIKRDGSWLETLSVEEVEDRFCGEAVMSGVVRVAADGEEALGWTEMGTVGGKRATVRSLLRRFLKPSSGRPSRRLFPIAVTSRGSLREHGPKAGMFHRTRTDLRHCQGAGARGPDGEVQFSIKGTERFLTWTPRLKRLLESNLMVRLFQWVPGPSPGAAAADARDALASLKMKQIRLFSVDAKQDSHEFGVSYLSLAFPYGQSLAEIFGGMVIAVGSDIYEGAGALETFYVHVNTGALEPVQCEESLTAACSALEEARIVMDKETVSIGESWTIGVELGEGQTDGSWVVRGEGVALVSDDLAHRPGTRRHEVDLRFEHSGKYNLTLSLMFANASLAEHGDSIQQGSLSYDEFFCGQPLGTVSIEVFDKCASGSEPGDWRLIEESDRAHRFLPEDAVFPTYEWVPRSGCKYMWYDAYSAMNALDVMGISEILILGDSRERGLLDSTRHIFGELFQGKRWVWNPVINLVKIRGGEDINVHFLQTRTNIDFGKLERPLQNTTEFTLDEISKHDVCRAGHKGIMLFSLPLWDLRHLHVFEERGIDLYIKTMKERCPEHTVYFLLPQAVHDDQFVDFSGPEWVMTWLPFQNRPRLKKAIELIIAACERTGTKYIDLFHATDTQPHLCIDGVHYLMLDHRLDRIEKVLPVDGSQIVHVLMQIILNSILN